MQKITPNEIINKIETKKDELTAVEIILNHENHNQCSIILNDKWFSIPYETDYTKELETNIKTTINDDTLLIKFDDIELPQAWRQAYEKADILLKFPNDRRLQFYSYNVMNEQFCIDRNLLWNITDEFKGTDHELTEENGSWMWHITQWYKDHLI